MLFGNKTGRVLLQLIKKKFKKRPGKSKEKPKQKVFQHGQGQKGDLKISRFSFSKFLTCRRCFYFDRVMG
jgi:hypothetical protein